MNILSRWQGPRVEKQDLLAEGDVDLFNGKSPVVIRYGIDTVPHVWLSLAVCWSLSPVGVSDLSRGAVSGTVGE